MLNYAETASSSTIVLASLPQNQCQQNATHTFSSVSSYAIGPINPAQLLTIHAHCSNGEDEEEEYTLLMPSRLSSSILDDPAFRDGHEYNYLSEGEDGWEEEDGWTTSVTRLANHIYSSLTDTSFYRDLDTGEVRPDYLPWQVGWLLRDLTRLAETDLTLAYVGMAHLCFLLPLLTEKRPPDWPRYEPYHVALQHRHAMKAYRERVHDYREQGKSYEKAQRLALVGSGQ